MTVAIAVVGAGLIGHKHIAALAQSTTARLAAIAIVRAALSGAREVIPEGISDD